MEAELKQSHNAQVELDEGSGGVFKVWVDRTLMFDKAETGRFPEPGEVARLVKAAKR